MSDLPAKFTAMADRLKLQMIEVSYQMSLDIAKTAFPAATVQPILTLIEIKPSDFSKNASEAVAALQKLGVTPTVIIADGTRKVILLAIEPVLPRAAKRTKRTVKSS